MTGKQKSDITVLVAEDNLINQKVAKTMFENLGYRLEVVETGRQAVDQVGSGNYDIVFMDMSMPEMDGDEATMAIRDTGNKIPIIAMTADNDPEIKEKALARGMNDYLEKPVSIEMIQFMMDKWIGQDK